MCVSVSECMLDSMVVLTCDVVSIFYVVCKLVSLQLAGFQVSLKTGTLEAVVLTN